MFNYGLSNSVLNINKSTKMLNSLNLELQTGKRINRAADDSSGLAIADSLLTQANGLAAGTKNANDAISVMNIADGALTTFKDTLSQMLDKATAAASDISSPESRKALQGDINNFSSSLNKIAKNTEFNGIKLLNGTFANKQFQVGAYANQTVGLSIQSVETAKIGHFSETIGSKVSAGTTAATLSINGATIAQSTVSDTTKDGADVVAKAINDQSANTGVTARAKNSLTGSSVTGGSLADGDLSINGVSIGAVNFEANDNSGTLTAAINAISNKTGVSARIAGNGALELTTENGENIHITEANGGAAKAGLTAGKNYGHLILEGKNGVSIANATAVSGLDSTTTNNYSLADIDLSTTSGAERALSIVNNAIKEVNSIQANVGAATNQLNRVIEVNKVTEQNVKSAESNIRDANLVDVQKELKSWSIKNQAALYSFSMAEQTQQTILSILR